MDLDPGGPARDLAARERDLISRLRALLARLDADRADEEALATALRDLEGLFLLVVAGEYNAGKSSLLNALLGETVMPEGVTPTTDRVTVVTWGETARLIDEGPALARREHPAEVLRDLALVDTPGTNAVIRRHQELTERFVPRADLVLFATSADRPFTESERAFLELIADWGKKIVLVVNKIDLVESDAERAQILDFVREHARSTLGSTPQVFATSARRAARARREGRGADLGGTGLPELEAFIAAHLRADERLRLKLRTPLGVARRLARRYEAEIEGRRDLLTEDRRVLERVERERAGFARDMEREAGARLDRIKTALVEVERRGEVFLDDQVRLRNVVRLMDSERMREAFEARVVRGADAEIDAAVGEMVDWFLRRELQLWEDVVSYVSERRRADDDRIVGEVGGRFRLDRDDLLRSLRDAARDVLEGWDARAEAARLAERLQASVVQSGLLQVGGIGLGAAVLAFVASTAIDVTGVALGLTLAGVGLLVLPRRRRQAKRELHDAMQGLRDGLEEGLGRQLARERERAADRLDEAIAPYVRFVSGELERLDALHAELRALMERLEALDAEIARLELPPALGASAASAGGSGGATDAEVGTDAEAGTEADAEDRDPLPLPPSGRDDA